MIAESDASVDRINLAGLKVSASISAIFRAEGLDVGESLIVVGGVFASAAAQYGMSPEEAVVLLRALLADEGTGFPASLLRGAH